MNCSEFETELELLVERRQTQLSGSSVIHVTECAQCRRQWEDYRLIESSINLLRPSGAPNWMVAAVLNELSEEDKSETVRDARPVSLNSQGNWVAVLVTAACLVVSVHLALSIRETTPPIARHRPLPALHESPVEVASSVAAVIEDLQVEYRELAAETTATARELASALPPTSTTAWNPMGMPFEGSTPPQDPPKTEPAPAGGISQIGRSFGSEIGQAFGFLRVAVPESVPRG